MNKKVFITIITILILFIIGLGIYVLVQKVNTNPKEIEPEGEITDEQMRKTIITLYYQDKETKELVSEGRVIDSKDLLVDPYTTLISLLANEPKNERLQSVIPAETRIIKTELNGDIVYIDLSKEFIDNHQGSEKEELNTIYSIVNTLAELNEVNGIKILINGKEDQGFNDNEINFKDVFMKYKNNENE